MTFDTFIAQAWDDHAHDAPGVAARLDIGQALVADESQFIQFADLVHHLYGDHLNDRPAGLAAIDALTRLPAYRDAGPSGAAVRRFRASLHLSLGLQGVLEPFDTSDRIRIVVLAISNLTDSDPVRAVALLHEALRLVESAELPASDPLHAELAQETHNMAVGIERNPHASPDDLSTMILAAQTARHHWGLLGGAADVFTGEYRLASAWRRAGDLAAARTGAENCMRRGRHPGGTPRQRFLSGHLLALIERDAADRVAAEAAAIEALAAYAELGASDQAKQATKRDELMRLQNA